MTRVGYHLISILFAGLIATLSVLAIFGLPQVSVPTGATQWLQGESTRRFESHYDEHFPVRQFGINTWAALEYLLFREGRPGLLIGDRQWLYTSEEFQADAAAEQRLQQHLAEIAGVQDQLAAHGTTLIVALVPAKARVYPEFIRDVQPAAIHRELYDVARRGLIDKGVPAPDLLGAMEQCKRSEPVFLRTDTHWTPWGASCAATAIGDTVRRLTLQTPQPNPFRTEIEAPETYRGDLLGFLPLSPYFSSLLPEPDQLQRRVTRSLATTSLLDETAEPAVVVVGTSYSENPRWNFIGGLQQTLAEDVLNLGESGRGPFAPMRDYLLSLQRGARAPRLLVWEIPERYLPASEKPAATARTGHAS